jgi:aryl-alcohol dehydrogenase-like predicted oxidoreductase
MIERREFGRTGHSSSRILFGAAALGSMSQERADALLPLLRELGVNHLDTAASYGESELRLAPWLAGRRDDFFVATKTGERTAEGARASLERSLERLGVDHVDLIQLHNLVEPDEWETAHGPGGAVGALVRARDEGLTRFIGVTGHGLRIAGMHRRSLERFDFDSVLLPYNFALAADDAYRADAEDLFAVCAQRRTAVQIIKSAARRRWAADHQGPRHSWYEPLTDPAILARSVQWVMGAGAYPDQLFLNSSSDAGLLRTILEAADAAPAAGRPSAAQMEADRLAAGALPLFDGDRLERI